MTEPFFSAWVFRWLCSLAVTPLSAGFNLGGDRALDRFAAGGAGDFQKMAEAVEAALVFLVVQAEAGHRADGPVLKLQAVVLRQLPGLLHALGNAVWLLFPASAGPATKHTEVNVLRIPQTGRRRFFGKVLYFTGDPTGVGLCVLVAERMLRHPKRGRQPAGGDGDGENTGCN